MATHHLIVILAIVAAFVGCGGGGGGEVTAPETAAAAPEVVVTGEVWPQPVIPPQAAAKVQAAQAAWRADPKDWRANLPAHDATGLYLNFRNPRQPSANFTTDADGAFMSKMDGAWHYDPVFIAQGGLLAWGKWLLTNDPQHLDSALAQGRKLIQLQDAGGALRYSFRWTFYDIHYTPGWTSAMAQGQALSLYARLYHATNDPAFAEAGKKALAYLLTPTSAGGVMTTLADLHPSLSGYVFFEELVTEPKDNYILNGYMFTLVGLYDWSKVQGVSVDQARAGEFFDKGITTLEHLLPYYEMGGMTAYDLTHLTLDNSAKQTISLSYHVIHVHQLSALYAITGRAAFRDYRDRWGKYLDDVARVGQ